MGTQEFAIGLLEGFVIVYNLLGLDLAYLFGADILIWTCQSPGKISNSLFCIVYTCNKNSSRCAWRRNL
jgi:hypothetical protein